MKQTIKLYNNINNKKKKKDYYLYIFFLNGFSSVTFSSFYSFIKNRRFRVSARLNTFSEKTKGIFQSSYIVSPTIRKREFVMIYCPECGGEMQYISITKRYACKSCGLSVARQELAELRQQLKPSFESEQDKRKKKQDEYLKWWLSKKK